MYLAHLGVNLLLLNEMKTRCLAECPLHTQGIQAKGKRVFPGERQEGLCPEPKEFCVCA